MQKNKIKFLTTTHPAFSFFESTSKAIKNIYFIFAEAMKRPETIEKLAPWIEVDVAEDVESPYQLIVWNDDVNTFDWVIETLVEVCGHTPEQAEQCALMIHFKGKYAVKHGSYSELEPMCTAITDRSINATIETTVG